MFLPYSVSVWIRWRYQYWL